MIITKFGGSSLADDTCIKTVIEIAKEYRQNKEIIAIVVSAFGGVTDQLLKMANKASSGHNSYIELFNTFTFRQDKIIQGIVHPDLIDELKLRCKKLNENLASLLKGVFLLGEMSARTRDHIVSFGERISAIVIAEALNSENIPSKAFDARNFIKTNKKFGAAKVDFEVTKSLIKEALSDTDNIIPVVTGFISSSMEGQTTTLGRGGSDLTASLLANALEAKQIDIWSDVDGILTANPNKVEEAFTIPKLSYEEAMELSHFGAKVIYPPTLIPALKAAIPIYLRNTFNRDFPGSLVSAETEIDDGIVKGISSMNDVAIITIEGPGMVGVPGIAARTFSAIASKNINISLITQSSSEHSICFTVNNEDSLKAMVSLEEAFQTELSNGSINPIKIERNQSIVAAIGENMRYQPGVAARTFNALGRNGVNVAAIAQGSSERNISIVISNEDEEKALNALHESLFLSKNKVINLFIIGVGLIGNTLIEQIKAQHHNLTENQHIDIRVIGIANSKKMCFKDRGLNLNTWKTALSEGEEMDAQKFVERMHRINKRNSIFVDNTANKDISRLYPKILHYSISISTPNKIASSSSYQDFILLNSLAKKRGVHYMFETNVAAGLPVITTLEDLIKSGDQITKIEAVLSGSLSYIFNHFNGNRTFHSVVKKAKELGLTEPDPREDLSGADVKRKVVILGRVIGLPIEPVDVSVESFIPT